MLEFLMRLGSYFSILGVVLGVAALASPILAAKFRLVAHGIFGFLLSTDKSWNKNKVPDSDLIEGKVTKTKTIIFIRHGESEWNLVFNKGLANLVPRLLQGLVREVAMLNSPDSVFFDSPLNKEGTQQALQLLRHLETTSASTSSGDQLGEALSALQGTGSSTLLVCSPLRRAIQTMIVALWQRVKAGQPIVLHSSLQEISRNFDTISLAAAGEVPPLSGPSEIFTEQFDPKQVCDAKFNTGNKPVFSVGLKRLQDFAEFAMSRNEKVIVVSGHSLFFKYFFQTFLPKKSNHEAKFFKIHNTGIVSFTLETGLHDAQPMYRIPPASITPVYKGFAK